MKIRLHSFILILFIALSCIEKQKPLPKSDKLNLKLSDIQRDEIVFTEKVFVPMYSSDLENTSLSESYLFNTQLSLENTDNKNPIFIDNISYYNSAGQKVEEYSDSSLVLNPLEKKEILIASNELMANQTSSFIVEWQAIDSNSRPLIQGVMLGKEKSTGLSYINKGKVIMRTDNKGRIMQQDTSITLPNTED